MKKIVLKLLFLATVSAYSQNVFQDDLSTYTVNTALSGQGIWTNNSSNPGGLGTCSGIGCTGTRVQATAVSYAGFGSSANSTELKSDADGCGRGFAAVSGGDVYIAFVINLSTCSTVPTPNDFFRVMSGGNFSTTFRMTAKNTGAGFQIGYQKGGGTMLFTPNAYSFNADHLVVFKYTLVAAGTSDDALSVFVDPVYTSVEPMSPTASTNLGTDTAGAIDRLSIRQNSTGLATGRMGLVSVARTWATLVFPTAAIENFSKNNFQCIANQTSNGLLTIKSNLTIENTVLNIYSLTGAVVHSKNINLETGLNDIQINALPANIPFVVEIISGEKRFSQKIVSQ